MKKYFLFFASLAILAGCAGNQQGYTIEGTVANADLNGKYVYMYTYGIEKPSAIDSALVENGHFSFKGEQPQTGLYTIRFSESDVPAKRVAGGENAPFSSTFILENGSIHISLDTVSYASGTDENNALKELQSYLISQREKQNKLRAEYQDATDERQAAIEQEGDVIDNQIQERVKSYISENSDKVSGGKLLYDFRHYLSEEDRRNLVDQADATFLSVPTVQTVVDHLNTLKKVAVGEKFTDFDMADINGNIHSLSEYVGNGKIVLIDFWASWCPPCRKEMPELVKLYAENKKKDFEIVGISLDSTKEAWKKGIADLGITWPQLSDLKGWGNAGAAVYGVNSIPHLVLVDRDGTIIAKNLHGEELKTIINQFLSGNN